MERILILASIFGADTPKEMKEAIEELKAVKKEV